MSRGDDGERGWNILLAEDNEDYAALVRIALSRVADGPLELAWVKDGDAALRAVEEEVPDLLILDLHMPRVSGHQVLAELKGDERFRKIPVAVLSASRDDEDVARTYGLGGNHFITKPHGVSELEKRLKSLLDDLGELGVVRRGAGEMNVNAMTVGGPFTLTSRARLLAGVAVVLVVMLVIYFFF